MTNGPYIRDSDITQNSSSEAGLSGSQTRGAGSSEAADASGLQIQGTLEPLIIEGNTELRRLIITLQAAANPNEGASVYDCINLLNQCPHCGRSFSPNAYKTHIQAHF